MCMRLMTIVWTILISLKTADESDFYLGHDYIVPRVLDESVSLGGECARMVRWTVSDYLMNFV